jgi:hypothetical protein
MQHRLVMVGVVVTVGMGTAGCRAVILSEATSVPDAPPATAVAPATSAMAQQLPPAPRLECQTLGYSEESAAFNPPPVIRFCNNTLEPLVVRRLDVEGLKAVTVQPDQLAVAANGGPMMGSMTHEELLAGPGLLFGVFAEDGTPRGRILYHPQPLVASHRPNKTCLSMATEPPFELRHRTDFPEFCP